MNEVAPPDGDAARRLMTITTALVEWAVYEAGYDMERHVIFDRHVIAEFIDAGNEWSPKVRRANRGRLRGMATVLNPDWIEDPERETAYHSSWNPDIYTDAEVRIIKDWARGQRTLVRQVKAQVLLALTLGAGLHTHEVAALRIYDLQCDDEGVLIHVRGMNPREVPVLRDFEDILREAVKHLDPDKYVFSPARTHKKTSVVQNFIKGTNMDEGLIPNPKRLRATWIVQHVRNGVHPAVLARAAGLKNLRSFERWLFEFPEHMQTEYRRHMRDSWRDAKRRRVMLTSEADADE